MTSGALQFRLGGDSIETGVHRYEVLEPSTATVVARFTNTAAHTPAVAINKFGKGQAIYLATESKYFGNRTADGLSLHGCGHSTWPKTPEGVYAR